MSDPTPEGTIRGWLETLALASNSLVQAEILSELRFLNQSLFGGTAISAPTLAGPTEGWLRYALVAEFGNEGFPPSRLGLAELLARTTNYGSGAWFVNLLNSIITNTNLTQQALYNSSGTRLAVTLSSVEGSATNTSANTDLIAINTARVNNRNMTQYLRDIVELLDGTQTEPSLPLQQMVTALLCICENTTPEEPPPDPPPPFNSSECGPANVLEAVSDSSFSFASAFVSVQPNLQLAPTANGFLIVGSSDPFDGLPYFRVTQDNQGVCFQLQLAPDDPGVYTINTTRFNETGSNLGGGDISMTVPPNPGQVGSFPRLSFGEAVYHRISITRKEGGVNTAWDGVQPVLYLACPPLS